MEQLGGEQSDCLFLRPPSLPPSLSFISQVSLAHICVEFRRGGNKCRTMLPVGKIASRSLPKFRRPSRSSKKPPLFSLSEAAAREGKAVIMRSLAELRLVSASAAVPSPPSPASRNPWKLPCSGFSPRFRELHSARSCEKAAGAAARYKKPEMPSERLSVRAADWAAAAAASASRGRQAARSGRPSVSSVSGGGGGGGGGSGGAFNVRSAPPQKGTGGGRRRSTLEKKEKREREREKEFRKPSQLN